MSVAPESTRFVNCKKCDFFRRGFDRRPENPCTEGDHDLELVMYTIMFQISIDDANVEAIRLKDQYEAERSIR